MSGLVQLSEAALAKLPPDGGTEYNRLIFESSPYLLQHAGNPVDWHPWGDDAFAEARRRNVPVFLSVGYATCHWCHVMERESFEDEQVAALLNQAFVCIKVDKEERPDLDEIYMTACITLSGQGGWPLTCLLTHDRKPFFAGTYYPKHSRHGRIGMMDLVPRVSEAWAEKHDDLLAEANRLTDHVRASAGHHPGGDLSEDTLNRAYNGLAATFDDRWGGFGSRPKFPSPHNYLFLLRYYARTGKEQALHMVTHSLACMRRGGVFDHVGFGFHRYSTDEQWLLPHFEKMLYDQATTALAFLEAYAVTKEPVFAQTAREVFTYVLRDMTHPAGGFFSAEDADSEGEEGKFYTWSTQELAEVLGEEEAAVYGRQFRFEVQGNFHDEATHALSGVNIPHLSPGAAIQPTDQLEALRVKLFDRREQRIHPLKDDKILTDWNGLMIAALALGGRVLDDPTYTQAAMQAAAFIQAELQDADGYLRKRFRNGKAGLTAHLDDYAFMTWGFLELHQTTLDTTWLQHAVALMDRTLAIFQHKEDGYFYFANPGGEELILRNSKIYDGAIPSGNATTALNLARLYRLTGQEDYKVAAEGVIRAFSGMVDRQPTMSTLLLCALDVLMGSGREIVIAGAPGDQETDDVLRVVAAGRGPTDHVLLREPDDEILTRLAPFTETQTMRGNRPTVYVCHNFTCTAPVTELRDVETLFG